MPDTRFGFATHFAQGWSTSLMPLIAATGVGYIRDDLSSSGWEPTTGTFAISASDKVWCDSAHANGLKVVGILNANNAYVTGGFSTDPYDPTLMANRAKFIAQSGLVDVIEVTNEPNNAYAGTEGANWKTMLPILTSAVTNAVRSVAPNVPVIGLGAQGSQIIGMIPSTTVDGIVYHPYDTGASTPLSDKPDTCFEQPEGVNATSSLLYVPWIAILRAHTSLPLWETEWGCQQPVTGSTGIVLSEDMQADYLVRRLLMAAGLAVEHTLIYEFKDNNSTDLFGVYNQAGNTAKAAYGAVTRLIGALSGVIGDPTTLPTFVSVANGDTTDATAYIYRGSTKTVVASWLANFSPAAPPAATTCSIKFTVSNPYSVAGSSVLNPIAGTSVPLSTYTTSVSGTSLTVSGLPISDHPLLIILMAANHYVRSATTGTPGTTAPDWNNAWSMAQVNSNQANIAPGDTVWFAGGNYGGTGFVLTKSGTSGNIISYKRATVNDAAATSANGWLSSFDSQVNFNSGSVSHTFACSFVTVDGQAGVGSTAGTAANRFKDGFLSGPQTGNQGTMLAWGHFNNADVAMNTFSLKFFAMVGFYQNQADHVNDAAGYGLNSVNSSAAKTNILFQNCSVRGFCETLRIYNIQAGGNVTYDNCYIADTYDDGRDHEDICYTASPIGALTVINCVFNNSPNDGWFFESGAYSNVTFSGNFFFGCGTVFAESKSDSTFVNMVVTNNIFAAPPSLVGTSFLFNASSGHGTVSGTSRFQNNILINAGHDFSNPSSICDHNAYSNSGTPSGETGSFTFTYSAHLIKLPVVNLDGSVAGGHGSSPDGVLGGGPQSQGDATGDAHLTAAGITLFKNKGVNLSNTATATLNVDPDGNLRGSTGTWSIGVFEPSGAAAPAPTVPTGLAVGTITSTTITLSWTTSTDAPNSNASLTYNLERKTGAGAFSTIKTGIAGVASGTITYTDSSLTASTLYTYNVQAQNPGGLTSAFTTTNASGTTTAAAPAPSVPTGLSATALTSSSISLSWTTSTDAPDTNASLTYKLQRKLGAGAFATLPAVVPGVASGTISFTDTGLAPSSLYTYNVQCVNQEGLSSAFTTTNASATTSAGPAVAFVQITDSGAPTGTATTKTATYALAQGATHTNIVVVNIGNASSATLGLTISSVADTVNGAYTAAPPGLVAMSIGTLSQGSQVFYRSNIAAAAAGGNTVTVTASAAASFFEIAVLEYSGLATTSPVDVSVSAAVNGSGATVNATSGTVSTLNANDLLLGAFSFFDAPSAAGTGYTARNTPPPYTLYVEDQLVTATGSYASTATAIAGGSGWTAQLIAFKAAPAGAPTTLTDSVALIPGTKLAPVSRDTHRGKPSLIPGSVISVLSRDSHRESVVVFPGSLLTLIPSTGGTITLPDVASISAGTALSFNARRTYRALAGFNPGIAPLLNPTLNGIIAPQVVQVNSATPSSVSTINCTYVQAQNRGDLNVVIVGWTNASSLTVNSVTDTVNGAYTLGVPLTTIGTVQQAMYFLPNILSASAGTNIVTVVLSGVATQPDVRILEYSGIVTSLPIDATGSNTGSNASPSVSVVSLNSNDLVVAGGTSISNFLSAGPLFTTRLLTADHNIADDAVFVWGQWVNASGQAAIHWEDAAWHWEDAHFWEQGSGTGGTAGDWINTGSTQGKWFG